MIFYILAVSLLLLFSFSMLLLQLFSLLFGRRGNGCRVYGERAIGQRQQQAVAYAYLGRGDGTLAVLSDASGSGISGKAAALSSVRCFCSGFQLSREEREEELLEELFREANSRLCRIFYGQKGRASVGALFASGGELRYGISGELSLYLYRGRELLLLSEGQSAAAMIREGFRRGRISREAAERLLRRERSFRYLGREDYQGFAGAGEKLRLKRGDLLLLLNKEISSVLGRRELEDLIRHHRPGRRLCGILIQKARERSVGEAGNAGVLLLRA